MLVRSVVCLLAAGGVWYSSQEESGKFVLTQGGAEVATERYTRTASGLEGDLRVATGQRVTFNARIEGGIVTHVTLKAYAPGDTVTAAQTAVVTFAADSLTLETTRDGAPVVEKRAAPRGSVPFVNPSVVWMEEILRKAKAAGGAGSSVSVAVLSAPQAVMAVPVTFPSSSEATLQFGDSEVRLKLDERGRIVSGEIPSVGISIARQ